MFDGSNLYPTHLSQPQFNDPWQGNSGYPSLQKQDNRSSGMMQFPQIPTSAPMPSDISRSTYGAEQAYSSPVTASSTFATSSTAYPSLAYSQSLHHQQQQQQRKLSDPDTTRHPIAGFSELDASRGMLALSHQNVSDLTPRNIYDVRAQRGATDSYGFPPAPSGNSSISAESGRSFPYYGSSVTSTDSATDYSSAASDTGYDSMTASRTLPRPSQLMGASIPPPQSMMGQFSSKMASNTQKKHKCKVCDKRFTRPSSLQTHVYSHTGEKPFACEVPGCGRHFSVVSNLRRHNKVHKGESVSSHSDAED